MRCPRAEWNQLASCLLYDSAARQDHADQLFPWLEGGARVRLREQRPVLPNMHVHGNGVLAMAPRAVPMEQQEPAAALRACRTLHTDVLGVEGTAVLVKQVFNPQLQRWQFADLSVEEAARCL